MTRAQINDTCDLCQSEIDSSEMSYNASFTQKQPFGSGIKNRFVSSQNKASLCKKCMLSFGGNYKIRWVTREKQGEKWIEIDPQQKIEA